VNTRARNWLVWCSAFVIVTALLLVVRARLDKAHVALIYLLVVLGGSAVGGRALGITLSGLAFLAFDVGFLPPYNTLRIDDPLDWLVLITFLVTGLVGAQLLERERRASESARLHAAAEEEAGALRRADRLKDALLASVSHDLRTPLTTIKGLANEIARGGDATHAWVIEEEADRLTALVGNLLELSQLAAGEMPVHLSVNTAEDVIGVAVQRVERAYPDRRVETALEGDWLTLIGRFDFAHTMRILTNLLENAAKYSPAGTPISLRCWRDEKSLRFAVEDAGLGISDEIREHMFMPFVHSTSSRGTGLGLSIARRLAEVQEGDLAYAPTETVRGRFVLTLPAADVSLSS
jgi:two-component system sensor histidine kinase KdpD